MRPPQLYKKLMPFAQSIELPAPRPTNQVRFEVMRDLQAFGNFDSGRIFAHPVEGTDIDSSARAHRTPRGSGQL